MPKRRLMGRVGRSTGSQNARTRRVSCFKYQRKLAKIHARNLDLEEAATHFGAAGDDATATRIREIETSFAYALEERKELVSTIAQLEIMAQKVEELNDAKGVRAIRDRITGFQVDLDELEENLAEVRQALARL
jgi:hypothetical protein